MFDRVVGGGLPQWAADWLLLYLTHKTSARYSPTPRRIYGYCFLTAAVVSHSKYRLNIFGVLYTRYGTQYKCDNWKCAFFVHYDKFIPSLAAAYLCFTSVQIETNNTFNLPTVKHLIV